MTSAVAETKSGLYPTTVFHANGVGTMIATDEEHHALLNEQGWYDAPQPPPPPAETDMTPEEKAAMVQSELEGLGDQVDAQAGILTALEQKIAEQIFEANRVAEAHNRRMDDLEKDSHCPTDFTEVIGGMQSALAEMGNMIAELRESISNSGAAFQQFETRLSALEKAKKPKEQ